MSSGEGQVVCVTGGSGYVASWLVKCLLERGYIVKTTVRDPTDPKRTAHLLALEGAKERLHLFKADLLEEGSFDSAIDGCVGVFHTASPVPFRLQVADPQTELIDPALKGTLNVLRSCAKVPSIKRVILTASIATTSHNTTPLSADVIVDETWYSDPTVLKKKKLWYGLGKTLAEQAAWKFAEENKIDLVSLHPSWVIGPLLQPTLSGSVEIISSLLNGAETYPKMHFKFVDVRDVAVAHIQAFELSSASERYILVERGLVGKRSLFISKILEIVHRLYPALSLPQKCGVETPYVEFKLSQEKAKTLGVSFTPLEVSLKDTIESLKEKGFLSL